MPLVIGSNEANWHVTFSNSIGGKSAISTIAIGTENVGALDQTIVNRVANILRDGLKGGVDNGWSVGPVHVVEGGSPQTVWDDPTTEVGTASAADYPSPAVALVVSKQTGKAGRGFRGRFYYPGPPETLISEAGIVDATYLAGMQTLFDNLVAALVADAAVVFPILFHDSASPGSHTANQIVKLLARNVVGTMRPRQRR